MGYKSIIVFLDSARRSDARMQFAIDLALRHGAHLTGLHVAHSSRRFYAPDVGLGPFVAKLDAYLEEQRRTVELRFGEAARARAEREFSGTRLVADTTRIYEELVGNEGHLCVRGS